LNFIISHLLKYESTPIEEIRIHHRILRKSNEENKVFWSVQGPNMLHSIVANRGKVNVRLYTVDSQDRFVDLTVEEMQTVEDLWDKIVTEERKI
jgi:hypothetical protein